MSHVVTSSHHITLKSGRQVYPGQEVSDEEAADNSQLVARGELTPRPEEQESPPTRAPEIKPSPPAAPAETASPPASEPEAEDTSPSPSRRKRSKSPASGSAPKQEDQK